MMVACPGVKPVADASTEVLPVAPVGVTVTVADVFPGAISTVGGTVAMLVSVLARLTTWPRGPAGDPMATVKVPAPTVLRLRGLGVSVMMVDPAVMVAVAGVLLANPSFTINCTTYVPGKSTTKDGDAPVGEDSVAALPGGRLVNDHEYVNGSWSASDDPLPSNTTVLPTLAVRSGPALATGGVLVVVIVTVEGALFTDPLFTINCAI
jgi:hypothetical protein